MITFVGQWEQKIDSYSVVEEDPEDKVDLLSCLVLDEEPFAKEPFANTTDNNQETVEALKRISVLTILAILIV